jgi:HAMP domain-containing protein
LDDVEAAMAAVRGGGGRGKGGELADILEVCNDNTELEGCVLDFEVTELLDVLAALEAAKEQAMADGTRPEPPNDEVKAMMGAAKECLQSVKPTLAEDSLCLAAMATAHKGQGKGGKKKGGKGLPIDIITECSDELDFSCDLDFDIAALLAELTDLEAAKEQAMADGAGKPAVPVETKIELEEVRQCLTTIKPTLAEDSACLEAMGARKRGDHRRGGSSRGRRSGRGGRYGRRPPTEEEAEDAPVDDIPADIPGLEK